MKFKKTIALLMSAIFLTIMLVSCENVTAKKNSGDEGSNIEQEQVSLLPTMTEYKDTTFTIAIEKAKIPLFKAGEDDESIVKSAVEERNRLVYQKYGVLLEIKNVIKGNIVSEMQDAEKAGMQYANLICLPGESIVSLVDNNLLYNMLSTDLFNIEAEYIDTVNAKNITVNNSLYMLYDSASQYYDDTWTVFYDKKLISNSGLTDPAILAEKGEWTWPKFKEYSEFIANKVVNKGTADTATDIFGFSSYSIKEELPLAMWESCGIPMFGTTFKHEVAVTGDLVKVKEATDLLKTVYESKSRYSLEGDSAEKAFKEGRLAFFLDQLNFAAALEDAITTEKYHREWGLLPLPKLNEQQANYCSFVDSEACAFAIPASVTDPKKSIIILNAFCAASGDSIKDAIYDKYVNKYFQNNSSTVLLQTVLDTGYFDMAALFGSKMSKVADTSTKLIIAAITKNGVLDRPISDLSANFTAFSKEKFK